MSRTVIFDQPPVFKKTLLPNGVRVLTEHHPYTRATCVGYFFDKGTRDEPNHLLGAAHFLEHLVFKGTPKRSAFQVAKELEAVGGELNAFTSREYTCFHSATLREDLPISLDVLSDILQNALLKKDDFILEREVVGQEIDMSMDSFEEYIFDLYFEEVYKSHPLGRSILGTKESLAAIKLADLKQFYKQGYGGNNLIISVAGHVDHDQVVEHVAKSFKKTSSPQVNIPRRKPKVRSVRKWIERPSEQVHVLLGFPSASFKDGHRFDAYLANAILGGGMTSRLYQNIREEKGLVYSVYSYLHSFTDSGLLMVYAGTSEENLTPLLKELRRELRKLKSKGVKKSELEMYKTQIKGQILMAADDIDNRMNSLGVNEMVFGRYRPVEEIIAEIDRVNHDTFAHYIETYFDFSELSLLFLGQSSPEKIEAWKNFEF